MLRARLDVNVVVGMALNSFWVPMMLVWSSGVSCAAVPCRWFTVPVLRR